jgi:PST family polysaccharide transporter
VSKNLFKNLGFLTISQAANYVLPLITIPYITRIVGPENYGLIEFGMVAMLYFSAVVIYGFNTTATRKIAETPENIPKVSNVFSAVVYTRLLLFGVSTVLFAITMLLVPKFVEQSKLMLYAYPIVLGWALYPDFLFQGLQKLQVVAIANFAVKTIAAALVFILLREPEDYYLVLGINSVAQLAVGLFTLLYAFKLVKGLRLFKPMWRSIKAYIQNGLYVFLSHFFTRIYTFGSIIFLGLMLSDEELGIFAAGMKLITVAQSFLFLPLFGALFPYLAKLYRENRTEYTIQFRRAFLIMMAATVFSAAVLLVFPDFFIHLVFGTKYVGVAPYLQIMAPILVVSTISHFSMQQGLIILKKDRVYLFIIIAAGVISLILNFVFIPIARLQGAAWIKLGVDAFLALAGWIFYKRALQQKTDLAQ